MTKLETILTSDDIIKSINGNLEELLKEIPEIQYMIGFEHKNPHHHLDVWNHTLLALSLSENDFIIRLVLLLHDIGKPFCYTEGEIRHFKGHGDMSAKMTYKILKRLNYEENFIGKISYLVKTHDDKITPEEIQNNYNLTLLKYKIQMYDALAHHPDKLEPRRRYLEHIKEELDKNIPNSNQLKKLKLEK